MTSQKSAETAELQELMAEYCRVLSMGDAPFHLQDAAHL
jgi:hypothetical protein